MTDAMGSTPITEMPKIEGMQSMKEHRDNEVMIHGNKFLSTDRRPKKERFQNLVKG